MRQRDRAEALRAKRREVLSSLPDVARLRARPPDCMIELLGKTWFSDRLRVKRTLPGWFVGGIKTGYDSYRGDSWGVSFAIGADGKLYLKPGLLGVGRRREFAVPPYTQSARRGVRHYGEARATRVLFDEMVLANPQ